MSFIFVGNWKMNPASAEDARHLFNAYKKLAQKFARKRVSFIVAPSAPHLGLLSQVKRPKNLFLAGQDVFYEREGPFTGFISPLMLYGIGTDYIILGHSERRTLGETNEIIAKKIKASVKVRLKPIVCIGESSRDTEGEFWHELRKQIEETFHGISKVEAGKVIIAYEPVWAVGEKSRGAIKPNDLQETILFIRKTFSHLYGGKLGRALPILYGGSVFSFDAKDLALVQGVSGFLAGRASLNKKEAATILDEIF